MNKRQYYFWLNNIEGIGSVKIRRLLENFNNPKSIYNASKEELLKIAGITVKDANNIFSIENKKRIIDKFYIYEEKKINYVFPWEDNYPKRLKQLYDKPQILYYIGRIPNDDIPSVAIIGSRRCTEYGKRIAEEMSYYLAFNGVNIISGLALGIDSEAHRGALLSGGSTFGVLAGGMDKCYPSSNYNLYMDLLRSGGIMSEYPPGTPTVPGMFPLRNRIVSGLSDIVVVVEAGIKSGSLITASHALEQNRSIYAVPGRINDKMSEGCNKLIREGAGIVTSYDELLNELGIVCQKEEKQENDNLILASGEKMLYSLLLDFVPISLDTILEQTGKDIGVVMTDLLGLELKGFIKEISKNFYVKIR